MRGKGNVEGEGERGRDSEAMIQTTRLLLCVCLARFIGVPCQIYWCACVLSRLPQDKSLFPIASLLETGTTNLGRVAVIWGPITKHLTEVVSEWVGVCGTSLR